VVFYPERMIAEKVSDFLSPVWSFAGADGEKRRENVRVIHSLRNMISGFPVWFFTGFQEEKSD
jgi:hypothetical protein